MFSDILGFVDASGVKFWKVGFRGHSFLSCLIHLPLLGVSASTVSSPMVIFAKVTTRLASSGGSTNIC